MLAVSSPGLSSTIQDNGRTGFGHLGVAQAGAADVLAMAVANVLAGNRPDATVVEMTLLGGMFGVSSDCVIAIAGADMEAGVVEDGRHLQVGRAHELWQGTTLAFGAAIDGARTYLALAGGVRADVVLGSGSTDPVAGFGGLAGRTLREGDGIESAGHRLRSPRVDGPWPDGVPGSGIATLPGPREVAIVPGPHLERMRPHVRDALVDTVWTVTPRSDRVGLRLEGTAIDDAGDLDLVSLPMLPGAVQLPADGHPIVLMPDAPSVGGYPVPAVVAMVDRPVMGQLRPGDEVRFRWTDMETARSWWRDAESRFGQARDRL